MSIITRMNSQRGFMSVESIANALFYMVMIAVATFAASQVMSSGKLARDFNSLSGLRVKMQYEALNLGGYTNVMTKLMMVGSGGLSVIAPGFIASRPTIFHPYPNGVLPSGIRIKATVALASFPLPNGENVASTYMYYKRAFALYFIRGSLDERKCIDFAYYGLTAGWGVAAGTASRPATTHQILSATHTTQNPALYAVTMLLLLAVFLFSQATKPVHSNIIPMCIAI